MSADLQTLRRIIELSWPELPDLLAENWPKFQAQLLAYLEQSDQQPGRAPIWLAYSVYAHPNAQVQLNRGEILE